jgi:hypothetical protein
VALKLDRANGRPASASVARCRLSYPGRRPRAPRRARSPRGSTHYEALTDNADVRVCSHEYHIGAGTGFYSVSDSRFFTGVVAMLNSLRPLGHDEPILPGRCSPHPGAAEPDRRPCHRAPACGRSSIRGTTDLKGRRLSNLTSDSLIPIDHPSATDHLAWLCLSGRRSLLA